MTDDVPVLKDADNERPIPTLWRQTLIDVVEAFKEADFRLERGIEGVKPISEQDAAMMAFNIESYGDQLSSLPKAAWNTSIYLWMLDYWEVLVDLCTVNENASDLVLFARVYEEDQRYCFEIESVHVP